MVISISKIFQWTSHTIVWLVFCLLVACGGDNQQKRKAPGSYLQKDNSKLVIPREGLGIPPDSIQHQLTIHLEGHPTSVLGIYSVDDNEIVFTPYLPFTRGKKYEVRALGELVYTIGIGDADEPLRTSLHIYPSSDTLPENLLKIYLAFSSPMQAGYALEHIKMIKNNKDTLKDVFLDLQPELWNKEGTILTLWLDPGRIKQDLQPNRALGNPLVAGQSYTLIVDKDWQTAAGKTLGASYQKQFVAGSRDNTMPSYRNWDIRIPPAGKSDPLTILLTESLDYLLLSHAIRVTDSKGKLVEGVISLKDNEASLFFTPSSVWKEGDYIIEIESRLEDLAGNNLNRLFDRDIGNTNQVKTASIYRIPFKISTKYSLFKHP